MNDLVGTRVWHPVQPPMRKRGDSKRKEKKKKVGKMKSILEKKPWT